MQTVIENDIDKVSSITTYSLFTCTYKNPNVCFWFLVVVVILLLVSLHDFESLHKSLDYMQNKPSKKNKVEMMKSNTITQ